MNKARRKALERIMSELDDIQWQIEHIRREEQDAFDNLPESIQSSERREEMEGYAYNLEEIYEGLQEQIDMIYDIVNG